MRRENLQMLISLSKVKKLHISEMEKKVITIKTDEPIVGVYVSMIQTQKIELKILTSIIKSEEENNGTR